MDAMTQLGTLYFMGDGVEQSPTRAEYWWKKAAPQDAFALSQLFGLYLQGMDFGSLGFPADLKKAALLCRRYRSDPSFQDSLNFYLRGRKDLSPQLIHACL